MFLKIIIIISLIVITSFCGWLFFWPLVECYYGYITLEELVNNQFKFISCIIGGIIFLISLYLLIKQGIKFII